MRTYHILQMPVRNAKGGITQYALRNWEHIDKSRFIFDWVTLDNKLSFETELTQQGCKVNHLSCRQEESAARFRTEMETILANGYDAIHLHTSYWRGFLAEELAVKASVPQIIVHAHSTGIDVSDADERTGLLRAHNTWKARFHQGLATHFAACSVSAAEFLFGSQIQKERVILLNNAIDTELFAFHAGIRADIRAKMGLQDKFVILQPARMVYQKNHSFTLGVFAKVLRAIPSAVLLFAGTGDLQDCLIKEAYEAGVANSVRFLGFRGDISELLQAADLFVMPSRFEGLGIAVIEAQCSGVKCLLSDNVPEEAFISENAIRLPLSTDVWRDEIIRIAREGYERSDRSVDVAAAGYSIMEQIKVLERIYAGEH